MTAATSANTPFRRPTKTLSIDLRILRVSEPCERCFRNKLPVVRAIGFDRVFTYLSVSFVVCSTMPCKDALCPDPEDMRCASVIKEVFDYTTLLERQVHI